MELIIRHQFRDLGKYYVTSFFQQLFNKLNHKYSLIVQNYPEYEDKGYGGIYSCMHMSIINPINHKYVLISFFDNWKYLFMRHLGWDPNNMTQLFYCGGFNFLDYFHYRTKEENNPDLVLPSDIANKYHSFFYGPYHTDYDSLIDNLYQQRILEETIPQLYFRGYMWDFRKFMTNELNDESILIIDKNTDNNHLSYIEYLEDMKQYRCALSLPGGTEICNRDIECFSLGMPVIRPIISTQYPEPLIPNYHYISCYDTCKYWDGYPCYLSYKDFQLSLIDCWNRVKNNMPYLSFVAHNARQWYVKNCLLNQNVDYVISQIDMEQLYG